MRRYFSKIIAVSLFLLLAVSTFVGTIGKTKAQTNDPSTYWREIASYAWNFFTPGVGVDPKTGMPQGDVYYPEYTDWDLATYIQAVMDAEKIGLINRAGVWGANDRIEKVLTGLETRPLMPDGLPYIWYSSATNDFTVNEAQVACDTGKLFVALNNLKVYDPTLESRIDNLVYSHTNYEPGKKAVDVLLNQMIKGTRAPNVYDYYVTRGFACFWPERFTQEAEGILDVIMSREKVDYQGVSLPKVKILCDPLLMYMFEFQDKDPRIVNLTRDMYLAQEARYNATGKFTACSEGGTDLEGIPFVYQWIIRADGRMWVCEIVSQNGEEKEVSMSPIIFYKAAIGLQALFNTSYTWNMVNYLTAKMPYPAQGYTQGVYETGRALSSNNLGTANGVVVTAARYAIEHGVFVPNPVHSTTPSPTRTGGGPTIPSPTQTSGGQTTPSPTQTIDNQTAVQKSEFEAEETTTEHTVEGSHQAPSSTDQLSSSPYAQISKFQGSQVLPDPVPSINYIAATVGVTALILVLIAVVLKRKQTEDPGIQMEGY